MARNYKIARKNKKIKLKDATELLGASQVALSSWESERNAPSIEMLERMADLYQVTTDFLLGRRDPVSNTPLPVELVLLMNGQPLWSPVHGWGLVQSSLRQFQLANGNVLPLTDTGDLYPISAVPAVYPYFTEPVLSDEELVPDMEIWLEPLSDDTYLREELRGWYTICGSFAENQNGNRFSLNTYKVKWLAFAHSPRQ